MSKIKQKRRTLAMLLTVVLLLCNLPLTGIAAASSGGKTDRSMPGLCEHHKTHTDSCGYEKAHSCSHKHTDDCFTEELACGYIVDEDEIASPSDGKHQHTADCYEKDCPHEGGEHDADCGYEEGYPCAYECLLCGGLDEELEDDFDHDLDSSLATDSDIPDTAATLSNWRRSIGDVEGEGYQFSAEDGKLTISSDAGVRNWWKDHGDALQNIIQIVVIEDGVETINDLVFGNMPILTSVTIPGSVKSIGMFALAWCGELTTVTLGDGITEISGSMFNGCTKLSSISLPSSLTTIEMLAFSDCKSLKSIVIPPKVREIKKSAFNGCSTLSEIKFMGGDPSGIIIGSSAFKGVASKGTIYHPKGSYVPGGLPSSRSWPRVESTESIIGQGYQFDQITGKLTVTEVEGASNWRSDGMIPNKNFLSVEVQGNADHVKDSAFNSKDFLKSAVFGDQVESIGSRVFYNTGGMVKGMTEITFQGNIPELKSDTFSSIGYNKGTVYCPSWAPGYDEEWLKSVGLTTWSLEMVGDSVNVPLELYDKVNFGGYDWWVIGLNGDGVYSRPGNITLLFADSPENPVIFGSDSQYDGSTLESTMAAFYEDFPENGKSRILPRPALNNVFADGGAGSTLTGRRYVWPLSAAEITDLPQDCLEYDGDWWLRSASGSDVADAVSVQDQETGSREVGSSLLPRPALVSNLNSTAFLTASAGEGGTIKPSGTVMIEEAGEQTFTIQAEDGYEIDDVLVDGESVGAVSSYTKGGTIEGASIEAIFKKKTYYVEVVPAELNFGSHTLDYAVPESQTVMIRNTGNQMVMLDQPVITNQMQMAAYEVGELSQTTLAAGETASFTVRPVAGLPIGVYAETITITGADHVGAEVNLTFTVTDKPVYHVTVDSVGNGSVSASPASAKAGETITLTYIPDKGHHFKEWLVVNGSIVIDHDRFTMPAEHVTVQAVFEKDSEEPEEPVVPDPPKTIRDYDSGNEISLKEQYEVSGDFVNLSVPVSDLQRLADRSKRLVIRGEKVWMTFETAALRAILASASAVDGTDAVIFSAVPTSLSEYPAAAAVVGDSPVYDFTIRFQNRAGGITDGKVEFPAGSAFIAMAYTPKAGERTGGLFIVYIDENGNLTWINKSCYSNNEVQSGGFSGWVRAEVPHFSKYGIAYKTPAPAFGDISGHWAEEDMIFASARGLILDRGDGRFAPDETVTRDAFVTALGRLAGGERADLLRQGLPDAPADRPIMREEMAVILANYAAQTKAPIPLPYAVPVSEDWDAVSPWATKEVAAMQNSGIIKNRAHNRFEPQAPATRAEVAAALRRLVEIAVGQ